MLFITASEAKFPPFSFKTPETEAIQCFWAFLISLDITYNLNFSQISIYAIQPLWCWALNRKTSRFAKISKIETNYASSDVSFINTIYAVYIYKAAFRLSVKSVSRFVCPPLPQELDDFPGR